jgi:hypothetical protein
MDVNTEVSKVQSWDLSENGVANQDSLIISQVLRVTEKL